MFLARKKESGVFQEDRELVGKSISGSIRRYKHRYVCLNISINIYPKYYLPRIYMKWLEDHEKQHMIKHSSLICYTVCTAGEVRWILAVECREFSGQSSMAWFGSTGGLQNLSSTNGRIFRQHKKLSGLCSCLRRLPDFIPWEWFHRNKRKWINIFSLCGDEIGLSLHRPEYVATARSTGLLLGKSDQW